MVVTFGQIVVTLATTTWRNNSFALELKLLVKDLPANVGVGTQTVLPNSVTWRTGTDTPKTTNTVDVTVVEPKMSVRKNIVQTVAAANDTITVTLAISNIGTSNAFSATVSDTLPAGLIFDGAPDEQERPCTGFAHAERRHHHRRLDGLRGRPGGGHRVPRQAGRRA